jgi:hypothetical protein
LSSHLVSPLTFLTFYGNSLLVLSCYIEVLQVKKIITLVPTGNTVIEPNVQSKKFIRKHPPKRKFEISFSESKNNLTIDEKVFSDNQGCYFDNVLEPRPASTKLIKPKPVPSIEFPLNWNLDAVIATCYVISKSPEKNKRLGELKYTSWITCFGDVPITRQNQDDKTHRITRARAMRLIGYFNFKKREMVRAGNSEAAIANWALTLVLDIMEEYREFPKKDDPLVSSYHKNMIYGYKLLNNSNHNMQESTLIIDITSIKVFVQKQSIMRFAQDYTSIQANIPVILLVYKDRERKPCFSIVANPYHPEFEIIDFSKLWEGLLMHGFVAEMSGTAKNGSFQSCSDNRFGPKDMPSMLSGFLYPDIY